MMLWQLKTFLEICTSGGVQSSGSLTAPQGPQCAREAWNFYASHLDRQDLDSIAPVGGPNSWNLVEDVVARPLGEAHHQVVEVSLKIVAIVLNIGMHSIISSSPQTGAAPRSDLGTPPFPPEHGHVLDLTIKCWKSWKTSFLTSLHAAASSLSFRWHSLFALGNMNFLPISNNFHFLCFWWQTFYICYPDSFIFLTNIFGFLSLWCVFVRQSCC